MFCLFFCLKRQSQLAQSLLSCSTAFSILKQGRGTYPSFYFPSDLFCGPPGQQSRQFCKFTFFLLIIIRSGLLAGIRWSVCMLKSHRSLCVPFSRTVSGLCIYYLFVWSNLNFLHISQWIILPTQSCPALYPFCANLLHIIMIIIYFFCVFHTIFVGRISLERVTANLV